METFLKVLFSRLTWMLLILALAPLIVSTGCAGKTCTYNSVYFLPNQNLAERKEMANNGDARAAFDVYLHYKFGVLNREPLQTKYWLKKAAALGNVTAEKHLRLNDNLKR